MARHSIPERFSRREIAMQRDRIGCRQRARPRDTGAADAERTQGDGPAARGGPDLLQERYDGRLAVGPGYGNLGRRLRVKEPVPPSRRAAGAAADR